MSTVVVRIEESVLADVKALATMRGYTPGEMLTQAWLEYVERHRKEIAADFEHIAELFRTGDREGLLEFTRRMRVARARAAATQAG
jgi:hypothetical protein